MLLEFIMRRFKCCNCIFYACRKENGRFVRNSSGNFQQITVLCSEWTGSSTLNAGGYRSTFGDIWSIAAFLDWLNVSKSVDTGFVLLSY